MRITQGMLTNQMMLDIQNNNSRLSRLQDEAASGKKINNPSDDPVGTGYIMRYKAQAAYYAQYKDNADQAKGVLDYTDTMLDQAHQVMQRARDLAVQGASDTVPADSKKNIAMEVDQLYQQLVTVGNSQYQGKYIFNGQQTTVAPYSTTSAETGITNTGQMLYDVGDGVQMNVNVSGNQVFGQPQDADNAFSVLKSLKTGLDTNNSALIQSSLAQIDTRTNTMLEQRADIGARSNRVALTQNRLDDITLNVKTLLSNTQDADMAQVFTDLKTAENVQQASLQVTARVIQPSLLDFLK